jgi:UDP-glucose 4-epimerase
MKILVTGSSGHLGEALMRSLRGSAHTAVGIDIKAGDFTDAVGDIANRSIVQDAARSVDAIIHTATLHKPHVATHTRQAFIDTNITGTLNLLEEAAANSVKSFVFTSTTSAFGRALTPAPDQPAAWITEEVKPVPKNIYGVTKVAAEDLCELFHHRHRLPCLVLRTSRFFPEADDDESKRDAFDDTNLKVNEYLHRRVDVQDIVDAHLLAIEKASSIGFARYIISASSPFQREDLAALRKNAEAVVARYVPEYVNEFAKRGWSMFEGIDRVYVNDRARNELGWQPKYDFKFLIDQLKAGKDHLSPLARSIGSKGYHDEEFADGPYPVVK